MNSQKKEHLWIIAPSKSFYWVILPLSYTIFIQALTGFPKPQTLEEVSAHDFFLYISEELFDYPYWAQDLSHLPLFFIFAWTWTWFFRRNESGLKPLTKSLVICMSFAVLNELCQFFIPRRYPSVADVFMNITGVILALILHTHFYTKIKKLKKVLNP